MELLAAQVNGTVLGWDSRQPQEVVQECNLNQGLGQGRAQHGATCLHHIPGTPHRYLIGSDLGSVFSLFVKDRPGQDRILGEFRGPRSCSPVRAVQRNPVIPKLFLTLGSWCAQVWSEESQHSSILRTGGSPTSTSLGSGSTGWVAWPS